MIKKWHELILKEGFNYGTNNVSCEIRKCGQLVEKMWTKNFLEKNLKNFEKSIAKYKKLY
jgi:hypothetical protein